MRVRNSKCSSYGPCPNGCLTRPKYLWLSSFHKTNFPPTLILRAPWAVKLPRNTSIEGGLSDHVGCNDVTICTPKKSNFKRQEHHCTLEVLPTLAISIYCGNLHGIWEPELHREAYICLIEEFLLGRRIPLSWLDYRPVVHLSAPNEDRFPLKACLW